MSTQYTGKNDNKAAKPGLHKMTVLNRFIISMLTSITLLFVIMISFISQFLFTDSIKNASDYDQESASRVAASLGKSFEDMTHWMYMIQDSLSELELGPESADAPADRILAAALDYNPNIDCSWIILKKGVKDADDFYIRHYMKNDNGINGGINGINGTNGGINGSINGTNGISGINGINDGTNGINGISGIADHYNHEMELALADPEDSPWYYKPLALDNVYIDTATHIDVTPGDWPVHFITVSAPLYSGGSAIGVCGVNILYKDIVDLREALRGDRDKSVVMLLGKDMTVLHAFDPELANKPLDIFGYDDDDLSDMHNAVVNGKEYSNRIMSPFLRTMVFFNLQPVKINSGGGSDSLYLLIAAPISELYAEAYNIVTVVIIACTLCLLIILLIIFFSTNKVVKPIKELAGLAQQVAAGNYNLDIFDGKDANRASISETAMLRHAFDEMLHALQENLQTVENRVKERTRELDKLNSYIGLLIESTSNISILTDQDLNILYCSDSLTHLMRADDTSSIIGKPLYEKLRELNNPDYLERSQHRMDKILAGEENIVEDDYITWPDGKTHMYRIIYSQVRDDDKNFDGLAIILRDLTDVRTEEAERRIDDMLTSTPLPCIIWDESGSTVAFNREAAAIFGIPEDVSNEDFQRMLFAMQPCFQKDGRRTDDIRKESFINGFKNGIAQTSVQLSNIDGEPLFFNITLARVTWLSGYRLLIYFNDISAELNMQNEAKEAETRIRLMFDSNPMICIMRDGHGNIIDCNQEALNLLGVASKAEFCENFYSYFPEYQPDGMKTVDKTEMILKILDESGAISLERTLMAPSGTLIPVETKIVRIPWRNTHYYLSYSLDLREKRAGEQKMREIAEREREARLQKEAAQAASEAKSQFLANMSHEIRTPMNAVLGMSELLLQEDLSIRQLRYVNDIKTSAVALLDIINDILDVSKIQAGKFSLFPVHYDFCMMIDNIGSIAQFLVEDKNVVFRLAMPDITHLYLYGDDVRLRQVLLNLLSNAVKFTDEGHVQLSVELTDNSIIFEVSDTGIGIAQESIAILFDAFEQFDPLKNRAAKGTGLGLAITKAIVEMMDGSITVNSVYGYGATFHVEIPRVAGLKTEIQNAEMIDAVIYAPGAKILVVDDNVTNLHVACGLLELGHIKADTATSGRQAIAMILQNEYDMVFMDHRMPEMSGIEATAALRGMGITLPIIALTASAIVGAKEMMLNAGMNDYLWKPIIKSDFIRILKKWIPLEKQLIPPSKSKGGRREDDGEEYDEFWKKVGQIGEISLSAGLERVDGMKSYYRNTLRLMQREIEKSENNLNRFLALKDLYNFRIEIHGIKGALANIGATELAARAYDLEMAADGGDAGFCVTYLPVLMSELNNLKHKLDQAFMLVDAQGRLDDIPPELPHIFGNLKKAFDEFDLNLIHDEAEKLDKLKMKDVLRDEVEQIMDKVMMMDYDGAREQIDKLLKTG